MSFEVCLTNSCWKGIEAYLDFVDAAAVTSRFFTLAEAIHRYAHIYIYVHMYMYMHMCAYLPTDIYIYSAVHAKTQRP